MKRVGRRVVRWLRSGSPPWWVIGIALFAWITLNVASALERAWLQRLFHGDIEIDEQLLTVPQMAPVVLGLCGIVFGVVRAIQNHPYSKADYRRWLRMTPWTSSQPLPLGPVALVPQDLVWVSLFGVMLWQLSGQWLAAPLVFLLSYQTTLAGLFLLTGAKRIGYTLAFVVASVLWGCLVSPPVMLALAILNDLLVRAGLARSLRQFPWDDIPEHEQLVVLQDGDAGNPEAFSSTKPKARALTDLGWPHYSLGPKSSLQWMSRVDGALVSLLIGFFTFVLCHIAKQVKHPVNSQANMATGDMSAVTLFLSYLMLASIAAELTESIHSPISWLGRIATRRLVIPAYDIRWLPTLSAAFVLAGMWLLRKALALPDDVFVAATTFGVTFCLLVFRPDRRKWRLTAPAMIAPSVFNKNGKKLVEL